MKKLLVLLVILAALGGGGYYFWHRHKLAQEAAAAKDAPKFTKVALRDITQNFKSTGNIVPAISSEVRSEATGAIAKLLVRAGQQVQAGQPLLELDQSDVQLRINEARLEIEAARLRVEKTRHDYERKAALAAHSYINAKDLQDAKTDQLLAENSFAGEEAKVKTLENELSKTSITAPFDGVILELQARPGMVVTGAQAGREGTVLMTIADLSKLLVQAEINEVDVAQLKKDMSVKLTFDSATGVEIPGTIEFISPSASSKREGRSENQGGNNQGGGHNFPVEISFVSTDPRIKPGMTANIEIKLAEVKHTPSLDVTAIFLEGKEMVAFLHNGAELTKHPIKIGITDSKFTEIKDGLKDGEEVSLNRPPRKKDEKDKSNGEIEM